jgi:hypothetical protein
VIEVNAFRECTSLRSIIIPSTVTAIKNAAFLGCTSLTSVTIPSSVRTIGEGAFKDSGLTNVTIPESVTLIEDGAFDCSSLASVTFAGKIPEDNFHPQAFYTVDRTGRTDLRGIYYGKNLRTSKGAMPGTYIRKGGTWTKQQ